jgi:hypothetical protein
LPGENRPVVYHIQFANEKFKTEGYRMHILDMLAAFDNVAVDLGLAALDTLLPGLIDPKKGLGDIIEFSEPGFTLYRDCRNGKDLRLHGVFGKFSVGGDPVWKPFDQYVGKSGFEGFLASMQIPTPSIRLCVQDFFEETGTRVSQPN